eukprot:3716271-Rhodomonas_salina.2
MGLCPDAVSLYDAAAMRLRSAAYAAMDRPVLTCAYGATSYLWTDSHGIQAYSAICLRAWYAMPGTDVACAGTEPLDRHGVHALRLAYRVPGMLSSCLRDARY